MVHRYETSPDQIVLQKKKEDFAPFDPIALFSGEKDPSAKFKKHMTEEQSLSFDPLSTEKDDIAFKKVKGMGDDIVLKKKLAEDLGEKKKHLNPLEQVLEFAGNLFNSGSVKEKELEQSHKNAMAKKYAELKQFKGDSIAFDEYYR